MDISGDPEILSSVFKKTSQSEAAKQRSTSAFRNQNLTGDKDFIYYIIYLLYFLCNGYRWVSYISVFSLGIQLKLYKI